MDNYAFCADWVLAKKPAKEARVLDYGCGAGQIVALLRGRGVNAFGCDVFYEGGDYSKLVDSDLFASGVVRRIQDNKIPFGDSEFDFVINNQVMEHVEDIDAVLAEISRVLKPGGAVLSLFPDKGVWREGHCGIPFLHWFPKRTQPRVYFAAALRSLGLGYYKEGKTRLQWSRDFCEWLDNWTHYRTRREINLAYATYFSGLEHIESRWLRAKLGSRARLVGWLPAWALELVATKLGCMAFTAKRKDHVSPRDRKDS